MSRVVGLALRRGAKGTVLTLVVLAVVQVGPRSYRAKATIGDVFGGGVGYCASTYVGHDTFSGFGPPVDINVGRGGADSGQPLYAPADGWVSVSSADASSGFGLSVTWTSSDGREKLHLAHLRGDSPLRDGPVRAGELIGYVGQTGHADGPHLHIARQADGRPAPLELSARTIDPPASTATNCSSGSYHYVSSGPAQTTAPEISAMRGAAGDLRAFFRGSDGGLWGMWQPSAGDDWIGPTRLDVAVAAVPAVVETTTGELDAFFRDAGGSLGQLRQRTGGAWEGFPSFIPAVAGTPAIAPTSAGGLAAFYEGADGALWQVWQPAPGADWLGPVTLTASAAGAPAAALTLAGELVVLFSGADGSLQQMWQTAPGAVWSGPVRLEVRAASAPAVAQASTGELVAFFRGSDGNLWRTAQSGTGADWIGPFSMGSAITGAPAVVQASTGELVVFFRGAEGALWHVRQNRPGGEWSAPIPLAAAVVGRSG